MKSTFYQNILRTGINIADASGMIRFLDGKYGGVGAIFMLHNILPDQEDVDFAPNVSLSITPAFLANVLKRIRERDIDILSMDEVPARLAEANPRRFVVFTSDDGYRNNRDYGMPVFRQYDAPFNIYIPSSWPEETGILWWLAFEQLVKGNEEVLLETEDGSFTKLPSATLKEKQDAYAFLDAWYFKEMQKGSDDLLFKLFDHYQIDRAALSKSQIMDWDELAKLAADPLVTIGAHSRHHVTLAPRDDATVKDELTTSKKEIEERLGQVCAHMAYPYGDRIAAGKREFLAAEEAGYQTATTTRSGVLTKEHVNQMTALPRIHLSGDYQSLSYLNLMMSGFPMALKRRFRRGAD